MDLRSFRATARTASAYLVATGLGGAQLEAHRRDLARFLLEAQGLDDPDDRSGLVDGLLSTVRSEKADRVELRATLQRLLERWATEVRDFVSDLADDIAGQSLPR